jgi:hypothetical protein
VVVPADIAPVLLNQYLRNDPVFQPLDTEALIMDLAVD